MKNYAKTHYALLLKQSLSDDIFLNYIVIMLNSHKTLISELVTRGTRPVATYQAQVTLWYIQNSK